ILFTVEHLAQEPIYKNFGVNDGLPSSEVYDLIQDKEGYIWFATDKGLSRFNGYEFENFNTNDGLTGNVVLRFYPQENGQIWGYSFHNKSLFYFNQPFSGFTPYKYNDVLNENIRKRSIIKSVYVDKENKLHVGGYAVNGELIINSEGKLETKHSDSSYFHASTSYKKYLILRKTETIPFFFTTLDTAAVEKDSVFIKHYKSARFMSQWMEDGKRGIIMKDSIVKIISKNNEDVIIKNKYSPIGIRVIDSSRFFVGYEFGGVKIIDKHGVVINEFLEDKSVTNFLIDRDGGYWFTTLDSGVYYIENPSMGVYTINNEEFLHINSLTKTNNNDLYIGYNNGTIAKLQRDRTSKLIDQPENNSHAIVEYDSILDKTYLFNYKGVRNVIGSQHILTGYILKFSEPTNGSVFGTSNFGFYVINENKYHSVFKTRHRIHDLAIRNKDTFASTPMGVFKLSKDSLISLSNQSSYYNYRTEDMDVDSNNTLYVASQGAGVIVNDGNGTYNISKKDGLNSDIVNEIYVENETSIWVCTNSGVNQIEFLRDSIAIRGISTNQGLPSNEIEDLEIINDTVWVGTKKGLCFFPKNQVIPKRIDGANLKIKEIFVNDQLRDITTNQDLTYRDNKIKIVLEGIYFANNEDVKYQYRLNDQLNWSTTKSRTINFSSLSPGKYLFEAKMCLSNQNCSKKIVAYPFTIQSPFWNKWWFTLLWLLGFGLLIYVFFKVRVLTYNKDITREFIRLMVKQLKRKEKHFSFREHGNEVRIRTHDILYIKSAGNYIDIYTETRTHTVRMNIGKFLLHVPDKLEYIRVHRSYIVRIDKITSKSKNEVCIEELKLPVSQSYLQNLKEIQF
nr:LytTR family transcriptional regulator DNA-binding domain-containing protein [Bacteroidota bacterium]